MGFWCTIYRHMQNNLTKAHNWFKKQRVAHILLIIILLAFCVIELKAIYTDTRFIFTHPNPHMTYQNGHIVRAPNITTPNEIQSWMTFNYLNFIFKLPPSYLQNYFQISDPHYPNAQIGRYARVHKLDSVQFVKNIQSAVSSYKRQ